MIYLIEKYWLPVFLGTLFIAIGLFFSISRANVFYLINFGYIGISVALGVFLNIILSKKNKQWGRRITQFLVGCYMLFFIGYFFQQQFQNIQIEGALFFFIAGLSGPALTHYTVAKVFGVFGFGRAWCGWACWTAMVLDFFPWTAPHHPRLKNMGIFRYVHFGISLVLVLIVYFFLAGTTNNAVWLIIGNIFYYVSGILLAYLLKDNRAFCKYICPIPVLQKALSRFSLLKIKIDNTKCTDCGLCEKQCPMNIKLLTYKSNNQRILSTECIFCNNCVDCCSAGAVKASLGFDAGIKEHINVNSGDNVLVRLNKMVLSNKKVSRLVR